jgi:hypothetical protein
MVKKGMGMADFFESNVTGPNDITPPRTGSGTGWFIAGMAILGFGIFAALAASGGSPSASAFAALCVPLGAALMAVGFCLRIAHLIELRLIDIQRDVRKGR